MRAARMFRGVKGDGANIGGFKLRRGGWLELEDSSAGGMNSSVFIVEVGDSSRINQRVLTCTN